MYSNSLKNIFGYFIKKFSQKPNEDFCKIPPLTEGYIVKGGINPTPSGIKTRPSPPKPMRTSCGCHKCKCKNID